MLWIDDAFGIVSVSNADSLLPGSNATEIKENRSIKIMVTRAELAAIDKFAEHGGHWSRAEAVRRLIRKGYGAFISKDVNEPDT